MRFSFFDTNELTIDPLVGSHHFGLVLLSYAIALLAAYTALLVSERVTQTKTTAQRWGWLAGGASMLGIGVWSMHFIGMLAFQLPISMGHATHLTLLSIVPAVLCSLFALWRNAGKHPSPADALIGGAMLGVGIGLMHYTGMAAMQMSATLLYDPWLFALSIFVALVLGILAMSLHRLNHSHHSTGLTRWPRILVAAVIAAAISGMHYTAMLAARFYPDGTSNTHVAHGHSDWLVYSVSGVAVVIAILALSATRIDRRLQTSQTLLNSSSERLLEVIAAINDGVVLFDTDNRILLCNDAFSRMTGYSRDQIVGETMRTFSFVDESVSDPILEKLQTSDAWHGEITVRRSPTAAESVVADSFPARVSVSRVRYSQTDTEHFVVTVTDMSEEQAANERIRQLAYYDSLTGLANRRRLLDKLTETVVDCGVGKQFAALLLLDIDKFKILNSTLGSDVGDRLLQAVAERLATHTENRYYIARLGGNEFGLILRDLPKDSDAARLFISDFVEKLQNTLKRAYNLDGYEHRCTVSCGLTLFQICDGSAEQLLAEAGLALAQAKRLGGATYIWFHPSMSEAVEERVQLEVELRKAIQRKQLQLYYQPQVKATGDVFGVEALVRWEHPERGFISPASFIPLAEETSLILPLGHWVLETACQQLQVWSADPELAKLKISVNVSLRQFQQLDFAEQVHQLLLEYNVQPHRLTIELTESLLMEDVDNVIHKMQLLKAEGVDFSLDDFGTGYSSLAYLMQLPFDTLKIDVSFVQNMLVNDRNAAIVRTIIALAKSLKLQVIAEGVEEPEQREFLMQNACFSYQGYLFGRPQTATSLIASFAADVTQE